MADTTELEVLQGLSRFNETTFIKPDKNPIGTAKSGNSSEVL